MNPLVSNGNTIRWKFENIKDLTDTFVSSEKFKIGPVDWVINIKTKTKNNCKYLGVYLTLDSENKNKENWICEADLELKLLSQGGSRAPATYDFKQCYHKKIYLAWGCLDLAKWSDVLQDFTKNDSIIIEVNFNFRLFDFSKKIDNETDMIVIVEETEFHLNKWALGSRSEYFRELILKSKPNDLKTIKLEEITAKNFCFMLASFYPFSHTNLTNHYEELIKVAQKFKVSSLHQKCEQYLMSEKCKLEIMQKIKFADENDYWQLMTKCIDLLKTGNDIKSLHGDVRFIDLKDATKFKITKRSLDFC